MQELSDTEFYRAWQCHHHSQCFSTSHIDLETIRDDIKRCAETCRCWRHRLLKEADRRGDQLTHVQRGWIRTLAMNLRVGDNVVIRDNEVRPIVAIDFMLTDRVWVEFEGWRLMKLRRSDIVLTASPR